MTRFLAHQHLIEEAAAQIVAIADDSGQSLVDVIAAMERFIVEKTKVGSPVPPDRRRYTLVDGRLVEVDATAGRE